MDDVKSPLLHISNSTDSDDVTSETVDVDSALEQIGYWGKFNILLLITLTFCHTTLYFQLSFSYFIGNNPSWKCVSSSGNTSQTFNNNRSNLNSSLSNFCTNHPGKVVHVDEVNFNQRCHLPRDQWTYITDKAYSYKTEFDLVCDKNMVGALVDSALYCGLVVDLLVAPMADIFGRKRTLVGVLFIGICASICSSYVTKVWQLGVLRLIFGGTFILSTNTIYALLVEFTTPNSRIINVCFWLAVSVTLSQLCGLLLAFYVREWRNLNIYAIIPAIITLLVTSLVPKSPRWLLEKGRVEEAKNILEKAARLNGKICTFNLKHSTERGDERTGAVRRYTYFDLLRYWPTFRMTSALALLYFSTGMLSYQVALEAYQLGANMYISYALSALADIPGNILGLYLCDKIGRKKTVLLSQFVAGIVLASIALVPIDYTERHTARLALAVMSKVFSGLSCFGWYIWSFESLAILVRAQGATLCVALHLFGVILVPLMNTALHRGNPVAIYVVVGVSSVVTSLIGCVLKETKGKPTRETFDDMLTAEQMN